jgi:SOS response associated peptidase (SRAP)
MCGRVIQSSGPLRLAIVSGPLRLAIVSGPLRLAIVEGLDVSDRRLGNVPPRYNAAPSQELLVIRHNHKTGERSLDLIKWGLIPYWCKDPRGGRKPINAKAERFGRNYVRQNKRQIRHLQGSLGNADAQRNFSTP